MKTNNKHWIAILIVAFVGMVEVANAFYDPGLQRWVNRDPLGEIIEYNLYGFVRNSPKITFYKTPGGTLKSGIPDKPEDIIIIPPAPLPPRPPKAKQHWE